MKLNLLYLVIIPPDTKVTDEENLNDDIVHDKISFPIDVIKEITKSISANIEEKYSREKK